MNNVPVPGKRRFRDALPEMLYKLRVEHASPGKQAAAIGAGVFVGCLPLYGLHFPLCLLAARLFKLNTLLTYFAAYINNPVSALFLTFGQLQLGHWLRFGETVPLTLEGLRQEGPLAFGLDLVLGSVVTAIVLGLGFALLVYVWLRRTHVTPEVGGLVERTAKRYVPAGISQWEFVRAKLRLDPLYLGLMRGGYVESGSTIVDLGCGRGIALALFATAPTLYAEGIWPPGWPPPPRDVTLVGIERSPRAVKAARLALETDASILEQDLAGLELPHANAIVLTDVLHYLPVELQNAVIERAARALLPGGVLLVREADANAGWRFWMTTIFERLRALTRGAWRQRFYYRSCAQWSDLLRAHGLTVETKPMSAGTPFGNSLLIARRA